MSVNIPILWVSGMNDLAAAVILTTSSQRRREEPDAERAAALAVLTMIRAGAALPWESRFVFESRQSTDEEIAAQLSERSKPLACDVLIERDRPVLVVEPAGSETDPMDWRHRSPVRRFLESEHTDDARVQFVGSGVSLLMSKRAFRLWANDYVIRTGFTMSGDHPTAAEAADGIVWVVKVGPPARIVDLQPPFSPDGHR